MARPLARFRYGATLDSYVDVVYPFVFDTVLTWRQPSPNSDRVRNDAGVTDGWLPARDFMMSGSLKWITPANWSPGLLGVQGFTDWVGAGNPFRFVPDNTNENFYVDNCYVDTPFMDWAPTFEQSNDSQSVPFKIRNATQDFGQALRGVIFEYLAGTPITDVISGTLTRGGTTGTENRYQLARSGQLTPVASSAVLRDSHYDQGVRTTLLENGGTTNLLLQSEDFTTTWSNGGGVTVTANSATAPDGQVTGDDLNFTTSSSTNFMSQIVTIAAPANKTFVFSCYVSDGSIGWFNDGVQIHIRRGDGTDPVVFTKGTNSLFDSKQGTSQGGFAWRRVYCTYVADATTSANVQVLVRSNAVTGNFKCWGAMLEEVDASGNGSFCPSASSYCKSAASQGTRAGEALQFPFIWVPQTLWIYVKFVERGTVQFGNTQFSRIFQVGKVDNSNPKFLAYKSSTSNLYACRFTNAAGAVNEEIDNATPNLGDTVELMAILNPDGNVRLIRSINGAAEVSTATSAGAAQTLPPAWSDLVLSTVTVQGGFNGYEVIRVGAGQKVTTIAQARVQ